MDKKSIDIMVPYDFLENPLHRILIVFGTLISLFALVYYRNKQKKVMMKQEVLLSQMKQEKSRLQLQAIISSFNPHFINNSLHWAQSRYRKDEVLVKVIGRLSENIRYIFDTTRKGKAYHTLKDEMNLIQNYVTIQRIRFNRSFEFRILNAAMIEKYQGFLIPIMQLQIHIENAIEHGLRNRIDSNFVSVDIEEDEIFLIFRITDDGCGREKANQLNSSGTQYGTRMLKDMIGLFNQDHLNEYKIETKYKDGIFHDNENSKYGTQVVIKIPKQFNYEI